MEITIVLRKGSDGCVLTKDRCVIERLAGGGVGYLAVDGEGFVLGKAGYGNEKGGEKSQNFHGYRFILLRYYVETEFERF